MVSKGYCLHRHSEQRDSTTWEIGTATELLLLPPTDKRADVITIVAMFEIVAITYVVQSPTTIINIIAATPTKIVAI